MQYPAKTAYLGALSLFFSAVELFIPTILPFFRIGLANIPLIAALGLPFQDFVILLLIKAVGTSYVAGTIFSPFFIMSLVQTFISGTGMYYLKKASGQWISVYSVSAFGALLSDIAQIAIASLYAGSGAFALLPLMLILSLPSSLITATISKRIEIPEIAITAVSREKGRYYGILPFILSAIALASVHEVLLLLFSAAGCFIFQKAAGREIRIWPHIMMFLFMVISSVLTPSGKVLWRFLSFPITEGALSAALSKSLMLSASIALSQGFSRIIAPQQGLIGEVLAIFNALIESFHKQKGTIADKVQATLMSEMQENHIIKQNNIPVFTSIAISAFLITISLLNYLFL